MSGEVRLWRRWVRGARAAPLLALVSAAALGLAARGVADVAKSANLVDIAAAVERGATPPAAALAQALARPTDGCGDTASRARLTVALALARVGAPNTQEVALAAAQARLRCAPLDGNAWLQWSRLLWRADGATAQAIAGLIRSQQTAPAEAWVLAPRLDVEAQMSAAGTDEIDAVFDADLRNFVAFESTAAVAAAYVGQGEALRKHMRRWIAVEAAPRRKAIAAEIDRLGVDFTGYDGDDAR